MKKERGKNVEERGTKRHGKRRKEHGNNILTKCGNMQYEFFTENQSELDFPRKMVISKQETKTVANLLFSYEKPSINDRCGFHQIFSLARSGIN